MAALLLAKTRSRQLNPRKCSIRPRRIRAAIEVRRRPSCGACHRLEYERMSIGAASKPVARAPIALCTSSPASERMRQRLRGAADVAVVESADLRQGNDAPLLGWLDGARLGSIL